MFTILANRRSGSHLLATLLDSHPDITMYDEVKNKNAVKILPDKKIEKLEKNEGCIILYYQFLNLSPHLREKIMQHPIIHLRRNLEDQTRSYWVMRNTDLPVHSKEKVEYPEIDNQYKKYIDNVRSLQENVDRMKVPALEISYEWLTGGEHISRLPKEKAQVITDYLGLEPVELTTNLKKLCS